MFFHPAEGLGRNLVFANPARCSNKKHFWGKSVGNYGFLTTEQIQTLEQLKQKERSNEAYLKKYKNYGLGHIIKETKYKKIDKLNQQKKQFNLSQQFQNHPQQYQNESGNLQHQIKLDTANQLNSTNLNQSLNHDLQMVNDDQQYRDSFQVKNIKRQLKSKKVKTVSFEQIKSQEINPQDQNKIDKIFVQAINMNHFPKSIPKLLKLQSKNFEFNHFPQNLTYFSKSVEKSKQSKSYAKSQRIQQKSKLNIQLNKLPDSIPKEQLCHKITKQQFKASIKNRLKRQFSPTFCNSFDYPLPYYRHI